MKNKKIKKLKKNLEQKQEYQIKKIKNKKIDCKNIKINDISIGFVFRTGRFFHFFCFRLISKFE